MGILKIVMLAIMGRMVVMGYGYGARNEDGSKILEFTDGLNLIICNTLFMKQESKLVTYVAGSVKSAIVQQWDKAKVCNVKVIPNGKCVLKRKLNMRGRPYNRCVRSRMLHGSKT